VNLQDYMAELAEEVRPVDLRDQVLASSRRATVRRRVANGVAASVVALAVAGGIAWAQRPAPLENQVPPATPATTSTARLPDKLFYLAYVDGRHSLKVLEGATSRNLFSPPANSCGLTVSPDGRHAVWVTSAGELMAAAPAGTNARALLSEVTCSGATAVHWLPASTHVLVNRGPTMVSVEIATGSVGDHDGASPYYAWSPNGKFIAEEQTGEIIVMRPGGEVVHQVAYVSETPYGGSDVQSVSDNGRYVVMGLRNTDPQRIGTGYRLVDATTGANVDLPDEAVPAGSKQAALYPARGNRLLVRSEGRLHLLGPDLKMIDSRPEPADLRTATLLPPY
jgi:hypothetical protein